MKTLFAAAALAAGALTLAACWGDTGDQPQQAADNPTGLVVTNARLILPPVAGNPAAVYFDLKNAGKRAIAVGRVNIADAQSATMHDMMEYDGKTIMADIGPLAIKQGETIKFEPGGKHVMAMGLSPELKAGGKTEMTLTIAGGDKMSVDVPVEAANAER